ncbi:PhoH family protein [Heliophilum fasciatum]|uniref:PhoH-like ATPase n=1 Tax=Heliophilum fasciatum TaxID=35700 RepID=A0A4R2RSM1_9FIRM|nr:PhoH family protein [Heliophilum fasciatum]MCW2277414.1 PhoH-like ATPase [Heliophilum fasciatum]TCP67250.1 PhoH-like ATPase [Heliophilum fasciatum]
MRNQAKVKTYILDTNILLQDPQAIFAFQENEVVIPAAVIEELDSKKHLQDEIGRNARGATRLLDSLREQGHLHTGVGLPQGGVLRVELNHREAGEAFPVAFRTPTNDNRILAVAFNLQAERDAKNPRNHPVIIVSNDTIVRIKADVMGIAAQSYKRDKVIGYDHLYMGHRQIEVHPALIDGVYRERELAIDGTELADAEWYPHEFLVLKSKVGTAHSAIVQVNQTVDAIGLLPKEMAPVWGIVPRNLQQKLALQLLMDDQIPLVTLCGKAGTGKTLLALAVALHKAGDQQQYHKILVSKPTVAIGKDLGALPGELDDKLRPWMQPVYDNLEFLMGNKRNLARDLMGERGLLQVEALSYIRGRSIPHQFIIVDEAQNLSKHEIKTIVSRVGEGSKIVLMGDPQQIDAPYLDETNNGLVYVVEKFKSQGIAGHVTLTKSERSPLAQLAADLL